MRKTLKGFDFDGDEVSGNKKKKYDDNEHTHQKMIRPINGTISAKSKKRINVRANDLDKNAQLTEIEPCKR